MIQVNDDGTVSVYNNSGCLPYPDVIQKMKAGIDELALLTEDEVVKINDEIQMERLREWEDERIENAGKPKVKYEKPGYIYLAKDIHRGCFKIGFSVNVPARIDQLKNANAGIEYLKHYDGAMSDEKHLHATFEGFRVSGEWFSLTDTHLAEIEQYFASKSA